VTRSKRRKKTAEARLRGSIVDIRIPAACTAAEEQHFVEHFMTKFERARQASLVDLEARARKLAAKFGLPDPSSIRWVSNQNQRWGSCTPADGTIRLSNRMADFPDWVVDYVIVHELAHLVEIGHTKAFWALVEQYPYVERARGYLIAKSEELP
jgi:predicted metal-dependent hydrolase